MAEIIISEKLIQLQMAETDKESAIRALASGLSALDCVMEGYVDNVLKREQDFPTGLPTSIPVAICHTEAQYVKHSALAVGTLTTPIAFLEMGTPEREVNAEIIFLLALNDPKQQVPWLKKMAGVFKDQLLLAEIRDAKDPVELAETLRNLFQA